MAQVDAPRSPRAPNTRRAEQIVPVRSFQNNVHLSVGACWSAARPLTLTQCRSTALPLDRENGIGVLQLAGSSITYWCASSRRVLVGEDVVGQPMQLARERIPAATRRTQPTTRIGARPFSTAALVLTYAAPMRVRRILLGTEEVPEDGRGQQDKRHPGRVDNREVGVGQVAIEQQSRGRVVDAVVVLEHAE